MSKKKQDWKAVQRCANKTDHFPICINTKYTILNTANLCNAVIWGKYILPFSTNTFCSFIKIKSAQIHLSIYGRPRMTHFAMKSKYIFLKRVPFRRDNNTQLWIYLGRDSQKGHLCLAIPQKEEMPSIRVFEAVANTKSIHFLSSKFIKPCWKNDIEFETLQELRNCPILSQNCRKCLL